MITTIDEVDLFRQIIFKDKGVVLVSSNVKSADGSILRWCETQNLNKIAVGLIIQQRE
jgi:hypothetical protein